MASIRKEIVIDIGIEPAWAALRRVGEPHTLFAPVLTGARIADDVRTVSFANGMTVHEQILDVDDERRRVAYVVLDAPGLTYHHASMQIEIAGPGTVRVRVDHGLPAGRGRVEPAAAHRSRLRGLEAHARERRLDPTRERRAAEVRAAD